MGFWDMLGEALVESVAETLAEHDLDGELGKKSDKDLMEASYELQEYFLSCGDEEKGSSDYKIKMNRKNLIESILKSRGYTPVTVYLKEDEMGILSTLGELFG